MRMLKKPHITGTTVDERQRQTERYLAELCEEIDRQLATRTLNSLLDTAIMSVRTADSSIKTSEWAKFAVTKKKLKELLSLLEETQGG